LEIPESFPAYSLRGTGALRGKELYRAAIDERRRRFFTKSLIVFYGKSKR